MKIKLLIILASALFLVACGGGGDGTTGQPSTGDTTTTDSSNSVSSPVRNNTDTDDQTSTTTNNVPVITDTTPGITGIAKLGLLRNATVNIYQVNIYRTAQRESMGLTLLHTTQTTDGDINSAGKFNTHSSALKDDDYYIYEIQGGENIDYNEDGVEDTVSVPNYGAIRALIKGSTLKSLGEENFTLSLVTEKYSMGIYGGLTHVGFIISPDDEIQEAVNVDGDVNGDGSIDEKDVFAFDPVSDKDKITSHTFYDDEYASLHKRTNTYGQPLYLGWDFVGEPVDFVLSNDEKTAYVMSEAGLRILDISNADDIRQKSFYRTIIYSMEEADKNVGTSVILSADETKAFLTISDGGLRILDISDPTNPIQLGSYATNDAKDVVLSADEKRAYIADGLGSFKVLDISNYADIKETSALVTDYDAYYISISKDGNHVFVSKRSNMFASSAGLAVIDVSGVTARVIKEIEGSGTGNSVISPDGDLLYLADGYPGLSIFDITDSSTMQGLFRTPTEYTYSDYVNFLGDDTTKIFLTTNTKINIADVSNSGDPKLMSIISEGASKIALSKDMTKAFLIQNSYFYIMNMRNFVWDTGVTFDDVPYYE